jgi:putative Holliday junction resolvase
MLLAIDYGKKRVGLAVGESIAFSRGFLPNDKDLIQRIIDLIKDEAVSTVIFGLPIKDSGLEGELAPEIRKFAERLYKATNIKIAYENESDSTFASHEKLKAAGVSIKDSKSEVDGLAAAVILESFINRNR